MLKRTKLSVYLEIAAWTFAVILLVGALLYYNVFYTAELPQGYEIGEVCPDFEVETYKTAGNPDGENFSLQDSRGQVTVLNFWYTSCGPCLAELPSFDSVQREYSDKVKIIALHSYSVDDWVDKQKFIDEKYSDYKITFAQDTEDLKLFDHLGGKDSYPMTIILDKEGVIRYTKQGSLSHEVLLQEVEKLL